MADLLARVLYGASNFLALPIEKNFHPKASIEFAANNWPLCAGILVTYLVVIFGGQYLMKDRKAFDLRLPLAGWNAFLCLFSFIGMCRTVRSPNTRP